MIHDSSQLRFRRSAAKQKAMSSTLCTLIAAAVLCSASTTIATDRFWSGNGASDNINDGGNWFNGVPAAGDNLNWNNTQGFHHFSYFNYGDFFTFGTLQFFNNAGGGQTYGDALKYTFKIENFSDPNQWRVYNKNVSVVSTNGNFEVDPTGGDLYFKLDNSTGTGSSSAGSFYFDGGTMNVYGNANHLLTFENILADGSASGSFVLQGTSQVRFTGTVANSYTGTTTLNAGTLYLDKTVAGQNAINGGRISINNSGSTVTWEQNNQVADSTPVTLNGGKINMNNGHQEGTTTAVGIGALTLSSSSVIDLSGTNTLHFADSHSQAWSGTLSIWNWNGTPIVGGGLEQLLFGSGNTALTQSQLNEISFYSDSGSTFLGTAMFATVNGLNGEIVPVPEPSTWIAGTLAVLALAYSQRRRFARGLKRA